MTNREFENYLALLGRLLRLGSGQKDMIAVELRDHLDSRVAELVRDGMEPGEATTTALAEFGDAASLAQQFQRIGDSNNRRWMMRFATLSVAGLFLVTVLVMSLWPEDARFGAPGTSFAGNGAADSGFQEPVDTSRKSETTRMNDIARQKLEQKMTADYDETPFEDVLAHFNSELETNIYVSPELSEGDLSRDALIEFQMHEVPASTILQVMLSKYDATYTIQDGIIRVITLEAAADPATHVRRIFNVQPLLEKLAENDLPTTGGTSEGDDIGTGGGFGAGGGGLVNDPGGGRSGGLPDEDSASTAALDLAGQRLTNVIQSTVSPDSWTNSNGEGRIMVIGGLLIVTHDEISCSQIADLLQDIGHELENK